MKIRGVERVDIERALAKANERYRGNLYLIGLEKEGLTRDKRERWKFSYLKVRDYDRPGYKRAPGKDWWGPLGKRMPYACWHAYGYFMDALPKGAEVWLPHRPNWRETKPGLVVSSGWWWKPGDEWMDWEVRRGWGGPSVWVSQLCDCCKERWEDWVECGECCTVVPGKCTTDVEMWDTPWEDEPAVRPICAVCMSVGRLEDESWSDFRYFTCDQCSRFICRQNPANGWHTQVRMVNECEEVCLRCYQEDILKNGVSKDQLEQGQLPGMFFNVGELEGLGFECAERWVLIQREEQAKVLADKALMLMNDDKIVVIGFESMAIGGLEGYVSLYWKHKESKDIEHVDGVESAPI